MKRSNILLIVLLIAIFIVPLGLFMAFKQMVREGRYSSRQNETQKHVRSGKTGTYRVVKITVPDFERTDSRRVLTCHLHSAKEGSYRLHRVNTMDSVRITTTRDTLFIAYLVKPHPDVTAVYYAHYSVDLYLPDMKDIVVNRATLRIDSIDRAVNPDIGIQLQDAILQLGDGINQRNSQRPLKDIQETGFDKTGALHEYRRLSIRAKSSELIFGYHLQVDSLALVIGRGSKLTVANDFQANQVNGTMSEQSTIVSNIRAAKTLSGLTIE